MIDLKFFFPTNIVRKYELVMTSVINEKQMTSVVNNL